VGSPSKSASTSTSCPADREPANNAGLALALAVPGFAGLGPGELAARQLLLEHLLPYVVGASTTEVESGACATGASCPMASGPRPRLEVFRHGNPAFATANRRADLPESG